MSAELEKINTVVGMQACLALSAAYGGLDVYLPERITAAHPIAILIGQEKAQALSVWMAGRKLRVPVAKHFVALRNARTALDMHCRGFTLRQIAQTLGVSQPTVTKLLCLAKANGMVDMQQTRQALANLHTQDNPPGKQKKWKPKPVAPVENIKNVL